MEILPDGESCEEKRNKVEEYDGDLEDTDSEDKIMHKVLPVNRKIEEGDMINDAINRGLSSFNAEMMFQNITKNFKTAKEIYGETILRKLSGYGSQELERNIKIPEFKKEIYERLKKSIKELKQEKILEQNGDLTNKSLKLAKISMLVTLDEYRQKSLFGDISKNKSDIYGENNDITSYKKNMPFKNISIRSSLKMALKRNHNIINAEDLRLHTKKSKQRSIMIYAIDASGSMSGNKIRVSKNAGLALAYHAIENKDLAGLVVFGKEVFLSEKPTSDFNHLLDKFVEIKASGKTDIVRALKESHELLSGYNGTRHIMIITDALPTVGDDPKAESFYEISKLNDDGITVSIIGIGLNEEGEDFGKKVMEIGKGKFYRVNNLEELNYIVLEDYHSHTNS